MYAEIRGSPLRDRDGEFDFRQVYSEGFQSVEVGILILAVALLWPATVWVQWSYELWIVVPALVLSTTLAWFAFRWSLLLATIVLTVGLVATLVLAIRLFPWLPLVDLLCLPVLISGLVVGWWRSVATALGASLIVLALAKFSWVIPPGGAFTSLFLIWTSPAICWLANRPPATALNWAWHSYQQALSNMEEARGRQAELARLSKSLCEACASLETANEELERARRAASEARRLKAEFACTISHELRTPLNLIIGFSEMLVGATWARSAQPLPESCRRDVEIIYKNACHLAGLVDDVLDLGQIEVHRMALQKENVVIRDVVDSAAATVAGAIDEANLTLDIDVPGDLPTIRADPTRIRQVLINLLSNALRLTLEGGITVRAMRAGREVILTVADTGVGIPREDVPFVFAAFHGRQDLGRQRHSGLGLAICKHFVELHGGTMWVESEMGRGTAFHFSLPLSENVVVSSMRDDWETWVRIPGVAIRGSVVVLDRNGEAPKTLGRYLDGFRVVGVESVEQAKRLIRERPPDALIAAEPSALAQMDQLRAVTGRSVPVIVCPIQSPGDPSLELGVAQYLTKPIGWEQLRAALAKLKGAQRFLVVDDDRDVLRLLSRMIRGISSRNRVWTADGGVRALALLRTKRPDAVLLDLMMPDMDGHEVIRQIRANEQLRDLPVIIISSQDPRQDTALTDTVLITRPGGLSAGEAIQCVRASLDILVGAPPSNVGESSAAPGG